MACTQSLQSKLESKAMSRIQMSLCAAIVAAVLAVPASGDDAALAPPVACANGLVGAIYCMPSKKDLKESREAFERGLKLHKRQQWEEAFAQFDKAVRLNPQNAEFMNAREVVKAKLVYDHVQRGNSLLREDARIRAAAEFRAALDLDPFNQFVQDRFAEATQITIPAVPLASPNQLESSTEIHLEPVPSRATFHFTGDVRSLFTQLAAAYSINVQFDDSVETRQVLFNVDDVDFFTALKLACKVSKTMWAPLDVHQMLIARDSPENHRYFDRMSLQTLVLPPHSTPQEATDLITTLRNMFELKFVSSGQTSNVVEIRGPQAAVEACARLMRQLGNQKPQIMLDVRVFQISHMLTRNIGVHIPNTFNMFNIPASALLALGGQNVQDLINQLISSGGINEAGSTALSGLLSQLGGQQNSIFKQPLATFGGGLTFMGVTLDNLAASLSVNESWVRSLDNLSMRAGQGSDATFHLGQRFPIMNASYAPIYNSPQISQVLGNQSYIPPFPSVSYEDLGLNVKVKPTVHGDGSVALQLELQVRSLTGQADNGVPVISNREYKGSINLRDGEPAFVAGEISRSDSLSMSGIPGLGFITGLNMSMVNNTKQVDEDELLISITPHVISNFTRSTPEIWLSER